MFLSSADPGQLHRGAFFPSGLYLVLHQLTDLRCHAAPRRVPAQGLSPGWGPVRSTQNPAAASLPSMDRRPGLLVVSSLPLSMQPSVWIGNLRTRSHQHSFLKALLGWRAKELLLGPVRSAEGSAYRPRDQVHWSYFVQACLKQQRLDLYWNYFTFSVGLLLPQQMVEIIAEHAFMLFPDKILFDHHILVPAADLPFSQASFSI